MLAAMPAASHWLNERRLRAYPAIFLATSLLAAAWLLAQSRDLVDPQGKPVGCDFIAFWSAAWIALNDAPLRVFAHDQILTIHRLAVPALDKAFLWHYPPTFLLVVMPLGFLPYLWAWGVFMVASAAAFFAVMHRVICDPRGMIALAAFPGVFVNAMHGQNGFLLAALLGAGLHALPRRPILAGICLGLMAIKPHLALLIPPALVAAGCWRAFAAAAATAAGFTGLALLAFGGQMLTAFVANLPLVGVLVESGGLSWAKMPTWFVAMLMLGAPVWIAHAVHLLGAVVAGGAVVWLWRREAPPALKAAGLVAGGLLVSPYQFDYDLVLLALPIAWIARDALRRGWIGGEREVLVVAWLLPIIAPQFALLLPIQLGPILLALVLAVVLRRALAVPAAADQRLTPQPAGL